MRTDGFRETQGFFFNISLWVSLSLSLYIYIYIYVCVCVCVCVWICVCLGGARGIIVIILGNGHDDLSSNPKRGCISHGLIVLGKAWSQSFSFQLWIRKTGLFNLDATIFLGEGNSEFKPVKLCFCYVPPSGQTNDNTEFVYNNIYLFSRRTLVWSRSNQERN